MLKERGEYILPETSSGHNSIPLLSKEEIERIAQQALVPDPEPGLVFVPAEVLDCNSMTIRQDRIKWWLIDHLLGRTELVTELVRKGILTEEIILKTELEQFDKNGNGSIDNLLPEVSGGLETSLPEGIWSINWPGVIDPYRATIPPWFENLHQLSENYQQKAILIAMGWANKRVAQTSHINPCSMKLETSKIYRKLEVKGRYGLLELSWVPAKYLYPEIHCPLTPREQEVVAETWMKRRQADSHGIKWEIGNTQKLHLHHSIEKIRSLIANSNDLSNRQLLMIAIANGWGAEMEPRL